MSTARRTVALPDVPTVAESGYPGFEIGAVYSMLGPAGLPPALVGRLNGELVKIVAMRDIRERFVALGLESLGSTPDYLADYIKNDLVKWSKLVQSIGLKTD